jgi:hypothetical protein
MTLTSDMPTGMIGAEASMEEEIEERKEVCAICLRILAPGDAVFPYGSGLAHWECIEQEEHK